MILFSGNDISTSFPILYHIGMCSFVVLISRTCLTCLLCVADELFRSLATVWNSHSAFGDLIWWNFSSHVTQSGIHVWRIRPCLWCFPTYTRLGLALALITHILSASTRKLISCFISLEAKLLGAFFYSIMSVSSLFGAQYAIIVSFPPSWEYRFLLLLRETNHPSVLWRINGAYTYAFWFLSKISSLCQFKSI